MKRHIPNFITLINVFCGCCAIVSCLYGHFLYTFWFLFFGGLADYLDGMVARWLDVKSPLGKELDSLADMVSFGVVPGVILYMLLSKNIYPDSIPLQITMAALPAFILSAASCFRLASFNIDERQTEDFIGLATPSSTMFVTGLMLIYHFDSFSLRDFVTNPYFLYIVIAILSYLLNAEIRMFSFKFKGFKWEGNEIRIIFAAVVLLLLVFFREAAFSLIVLTYVIFAIGHSFLKK